MTHKDQNKILDNKTKSNINQYKVDRLNAEISAFLSGDLNKYEFLTRKDLKYKPNALDKAKKDIRDGLAGGVNRRSNDNRPDDNRPDNSFDNDSFDDDSFDDDSFDTPYDTPYDTTYTSDDEDDIENNKKIYDNLLLKYVQLKKISKKQKMN